MSSLGVRVVAVLVLVVMGCGRVGYDSHAMLDADVPRDVAMPSDLAVFDMVVDAPPPPDASDDADSSAPAMAGFVVTPVDGLVISETGSTATFSVRLMREPTATVSTILSTSDSSEATVRPAFLSFVPSMWAAEQFVTVTGVDDSIQDGNQPFLIVTSNATSADPDYDNLDVPDVAGTTLDDESPGIVVTAVSSSTTTEAGGSISFNVVLQSAPTEDVAIALASSDPSEGIVAPSSVMFTPANWFMPQVVTVTGADDSAADGDIAYVVSVGPSTSLQADYSGLSAMDVALVNLDDESPHLLVTPLDGLITTEGGATATFSVVLASEPTATVTLAVSSLDASEGSAAPSSLTFLVGNWMTPQVVTVSGVDDFVEDGDIAYDVRVNVAATSDTGYAALSPIEVGCLNVDDESPGITVAPTLGLTTSESGATSTFSVVLNSEPASDVTIALASDTESEGTVLPVSLTFTSLNWESPQTVTVTGVDDAVADGTRAYTIVTAAAISADPDYSGRDAADVAVNNLDNDTAGVSISPLSGLVTTEAGGTATFSVVLNVAPVMAVMLDFSSSDLSEGTVSPTHITFTPANWDTPRTLTVTGVDDSLDDGDVAFTILTPVTSSPGSVYDGLPVSDIAVVNTDDDTASVNVTPTSGLTTTEAGGTATFAVVLTSQPTADVVLGITSNDTTEGTVFPASLTFTSANWSTPQTVTVTGVNDTLDDGDIDYLVGPTSSVSADPSYAVLETSAVMLTNVDNDPFSVIVNPSSGLVTTEAGGTATFTVRLGNLPTANVSIALSSSNTAEGTVSPASLTFTTANWSTNQTVTVTGVNDAVDDGDIAYTIVTGAAASTDMDFNGIAVNDVSVTNTDNDTAAVVVTPTSGLVTSERGTTATFTMALATQPTADVVIGISSSNVSEGTVSPASLTFTNSNWSTPQTVTVIGVNESVLDADVAYSIVTAAAASTDGAYSGLAVADVSVTNWTLPTYLKASNTGSGDEFGTAVALSGDTNTVVVGARLEDSNATGINGDGTNNLALDSGAAYVFVRSGATWVQQAYLKASNTDAGDYFGSAVAISSDGNTIAVGAMLERSAATGVGGNQASNTIYGAGAVYVFTRSGTTWTQQAYIKAADVAADDYFGSAVALSSDGATLAVGAPHETGAGFGVDPAHARAAPWRGAAYVFTRSMGTWSQQAYIKDSVSSRYFGAKVVLSADGNTLAVNNLSAIFSTLQNGVTVFVRSGSTWSQQQRLIEPAWAGVNTAFGLTISLAADGNTLFAGCVDPTTTTGVLYTRSGVVWSLGPTFNKTISGTGYGSQAVISGDGAALLLGSTTEDSAARRLNGDETSSSLDDSGASWLLRNSAGTWSQAFYVKSHEPGAMDWFGGESSFGGVRSALSSTGSTIVVSALHEDSNATGVNGDATSNSAADSGAVYIYE